jgi:large-conductance mechanosensitive channel
MCIDGRAFERAFMVAIAVAVVVGFAVGALVFWITPLAWSWLKPFIHAMTA